MDGSKDVFATISILFTTSCVNSRKWAMRGKTRWLRYAEEIRHQTLGGGGFWQKEVGGVDKGGFCDDVSIGCGVKYMNVCMKFKWGWMRQY